MLSAIIFATDAIDGPARADFVARCLASLIEACVQGVVAPRRALTGIDPAFEAANGFPRLARKLKGADLSTRARRLT